MTAMTTAQTRAAPVYARHGRALSASQLGPAASRSSVATVRASRSSASAATITAANSHINTAASSRPPSSRANVDGIAPATNTSDGESSSLALPRLDLTNLTEEQRSLFHYYQRRVDSFESERQDFLARIQSLNGTVSERQSLQMENSNHAYTIAQLQRELSDARIVVNQHERQYLDASNEIQSLRISAIEDRKRIQSLMALTRDYRKTKKEFQERNYPLNTNLGARAKRALTAGDGGGDEANDAMAVQRILHEMQQSYAKTHSSYKSHTLILLADRQARESQHRQEIEQCQKSVDRTLAAYTEMKGFYERTLNDYFALKHRSSSSEKKLQERIASLSTIILNQQRNFQTYREKQERMKRKFLSQHHSKATASSSGGNSETQRSGTSMSVRELNDGDSNPSCADDDWLRLDETRLALALLQAEHQSVKEELSIVSSQYDATSTLYREKIQHLETELRNVRDKYRTVSERRMLDSEGFRNDVKSMRAEIAKLKEIVLYGSSPSSNALDEELLELEGRLNALQRQLSRDDCGASARHAK